MPGILLIRMPFLILIKFLVSSNTGHSAYEVLIKCQGSKWIKDRKNEHLSVGILAPAFSILLQPFKWVRCSIEMRLEDMGQSPFLLLWGPLFFAHDTLARLDVLRPDSEGLSLSFRWGIALPFMGWGLQFRVLCWPSAPLWSIFFLYALSSCPCRSHFLIS